MNIDPRAKVRMRSIVPLIDRYCSMKTLASASVADLGGSCGYLLNLIGIKYPAIAQLHSVEIDPDAIRVGKRYFPHIDFIEASATRTTLPVSSQALIFSSEIFDYANGHIKKEFDLIDLGHEIIRIAQPGAYYFSLESTPREWEIEKLMKSGLSMVTHDENYRCTMFRIA